jgi:hypothetical protein
MPATGQNIAVYAGNTAKIRIPVSGTDINGTPDGSYVDLSGASAKWRMAKNAKATGSDIYIVKDSSQTMVCDDTVTRQQIEIERETDLWVLIIHLNGDDTDTGHGSNPKPGTYYHEARVIDAVGNMSTVSLGSFTLAPTVNRTPDDGG